MKLGLVLALALVSFAAVQAGCSQPREKAAGDVANLPVASPQTGHVIVAVQPEQPRPEPPVNAPPPGARYRVSKTDTAKSIALRFYGDEDFAQDIVEFNKEAIRQAKGLKAGLVISLPPARQRDRIARP